MGQVAGDEVKEGSMIWREPEREEIAAYKHGFWFFIGHDVKQFPIPIDVAVEVGDKKASGHGDSLCFRIRQAGGMVDPVFIYSYPFFNDPYNYCPQLGSLAVDRTQRFRQF